MNRQFTKELGKVNKFIKSVQLHAGKCELENEL